MGSGTWKIEGKDFRAAGLAFLAACLPIAIWSALNSPGVGSDQNSPFYIIVLWSGIFFFYTLWLAGMIAFPLFVVLNRFCLLSAPSAVISGATVGAGVTFLIASSHWSERAPKLSIAGAFFGGIFWLLYRFLRRQTQSR